MVHSDAWRPDSLKRFLRPPGNGVFTVHTAQDIIASVQRELYSSAGGQDQIEHAWLTSLKDVTTTDKTLLLGVCHDNGGGIQRGANWGPLFVRRALLERVSSEDFIDLGDVPVIPHLLHDKYLNEETLNACREALYQDATCQLPVSPLSITEYVCDLLYALPQSPPILGLGGDHSVSYPLVRSWLKNKRAQNKRVSVIHFDAHTDLMERRLGIDLCFATWAYHILELLESPRDLLQYGIRSSGKTKAYWEETLGIQQFWGDELRHNTQLAAQRLHDYLTTQHVEEVYISFDIDAMDESLASATGTPEPDGLHLTHVSDILDAIPSSCQVTGADLVEVAPWVNRAMQGEESTRSTRDPTLDTAGEITAMLLRLLNT